MLGVSLAAAKASAAEAGVSLFRYLGGEEARVLPVPMMNVINGGVHADNSIDLQEFMVVPAGASTLRRGDADRHGDLPLAEGGAPRARPLDGGRRRGRLRARISRSSEEAIEAILEAAERAGHRERVAIALDPASTEFFADGVYRFEGREADGAAMADFYAGLAERYPLVSIEDGLAEDDWAAWRALTERLGDRVQLVGDDLFVTNVERLRRGIDEGVANAILVKVNQIGTLTETLDTIGLARSNGYRR